TYIPRMLPLVLLRDIKLPPFLDRFLQFIPPAVLGALIFPGILTSTGNLASAIAGGIAALILALLNLNLTLVVIGGILSALLYQILL
ncbi:MAG: AzlD domain-containing protein, partial [Clostridiales bacterium]|nr:AzlD domain-containing protein [Clostridiales bacterium]